ncbi:MAG: molybdenum ABC transporter ATP-binding protein [Candidatus Acidiferrum sp.]
MVSVALPVNPAALTARIRAQLRAANSPPFQLDVSLEVSPGISILFGPSGAGKSTTLDCIAGILRPDNARISVGGAVLHDSEKKIDLPPDKRRVAYVFQSLALFPVQTVEENVSYGLSAMPVKERRERVMEILKDFRVGQLAKRNPSEISGGEKQRVALARSLVTQPRALLLDEPLANLDAHLKSSIMEDLRAWNTARNIPILCVTHNRDEVDTLGERVIAMDHGRIVGEGLPRDVLDAPRKSRLAQSAGFENLLSGIVLELLEADGVMRIQLDPPCEIEVPLGHSSVGDRVQVAIRAGDILLASEKPCGLSAQNLLEGRILSVEQRGTLVVVHVNCGPVFTAHVTPRAVRSLELAAGRLIWLVLKTHSCHLVND